MCCGVCRRRIYEALCRQHDNCGMLSPVNNSDNGKKRIIKKGGRTMPGLARNPIRSLGVLTGGGDVPGLNAAIKAIVYRGEATGIRVTGLRAGWEGITYIDRSRSRDDLVFRSDDPNAWQGHYLMPLNKLNTRTIDRQGGTILQSTR